MMTQAEHVIPTEKRDRLELLLLQDCGHWTVHLNPHHKEKRRECS